MRVTARQSVERHLARCRGEEHEFPLIGLHPAQSAGRPKRPGPVAAERVVAAGIENEETEPRAGRAHQARQMGELDPVAKEKNLLHPLGAAGIWHIHRQQIKRIPPVFVELHTMAGENHHRDIARTDRGEKPLNPAIHRRPVGVFEVDHLEVAQRCQMMPIGPGVGHRAFQGRDMGISVVADDERDPPAGLCRRAGGQGRADRGRQGEPPNRPHQRGEQGSHRRLPQITQKPTSVSSSVRKRFSELSAKERSRSARSARPASKASSQNARPAASGARPSTFS